RWASAWRRGSARVARAALARSPPCTASWPCAWWVRPTAEGAAPPRSGALAVFDQRWRGPLLVRGCCGRGRRRRGGGRGARRGGGAARSGGRGAVVVGGGRGLVGVLGGGGRGLGRGRGLRVERGGGRRGPEPLVGRSWEVLDLAALHRGGHEALPDLGREGAAGDASALHVVHRGRLRVAHPDHRRVAGHVAGEPGVHVALRGAGLAGGGAPDAS